MIDKKTFVQIINNIVEQEKIDSDFGKALESVCDSYCLYGTKNKIYQSLFLTLKEIFKDKNDWIVWWIYETDCGKNKELKAYYKNKKEIKLNTSEQLYDFLIKNMKG